MKREERTGILQQQAADAERAFREKELEYNKLVDEIEREGKTIRATEQAVKREMA